MTRTALVTAVRNCARALALAAALTLTGAAHAAADLVVGQVAPLTGSNAVNGMAVMQGAKLYFDYLNSKGGINGKKVRFLPRDDGYKVEETVRQARELVSKEGALVLLTTLGTANNEALVNESVVGSEGIAMVGPRSGASSLYTASGVYPTRASYHDEARAIVRQLATIGITRIAAVVQGDSFGKDALTGVKEAMKNNRLELVAESEFERNTEKIEPAVETMLKANPQAIVLLAITNPAVAFIKAFRERGGTSRILCLSIVDPETVLNKAGAKAARGVAMTVVVPSPGKRTLPIIKEILQAAEATGNRNFKPTLNSIEGYINAKVVAEALRKAGNDPTRASVQRALAGLSQVDVGGFIAKLRIDPTEQRYVDLGVIGPTGALLQ